MFDLDAAIVDFKSRMSRTGTCSAPDLAELESHLRDSVDRLTAGGLSPEEAFLVAAHRLGRPDSLAVEYAAAHPERLWRDRAMWMMAGLLAWGAISSLSDLVPAVGLSVAAVTGAHGNTLGLVSLASGVVGLLATVTVAIVLYRRLARKPFNFGPVAWVVIALGSIVAMRVIIVASFAIMARNLPPQDLGAASISRSYLGLALSLLFPIAFAVLIVRISRRNRAETC
jgi:hypothetical protein